MVDNSVSEITDGERAGMGRSLLRCLQEDFAGRFSADVTELLGREVSVGVSTYKQMTYGEFLVGLGEPACCGILVCEESAQGVWVEIAPRVAYLLVDSFLSGPCGDGTYFPARPLSDVERRLLRRVFKKAGRCLSRAWPVEDAPEFHPLEDDSASAKPRQIDSDSPVNVLEFTISFGGATDSMRLCIPRATLCCDSEQSSAGHIRRGPVEITASLAEISLSRDEWSDLAEGDILTTDTPVDGEVIVRVAGIPKYLARLGACQGRRAVTITGRVAKTKDKTTNDLSTNYTKNTKKAND